MPTFPTPIQYSFGILRQTSKTRARNKRDSAREGRIQTISICRWHDPIPKRLPKLYKNDYKKW
jgi:hypothetical protein